MLSRGRPGRFRFAGALLVVGWLTGQSCAETGTKPDVPFAWTLPAEALQVDARMNVYLAGQSDTPADPFHGLLPLALALEGAKAVQFPTIEGEVGCAGQISLVGPDGGTCMLSNTEIAPANGFSGTISADRAFYLVGVFAKGADPTNPPNDLTVPATDTALQLTPVLNQVFAVGDGRTNDGSMQTIVVPEGADTLYLGYADAAGLIGHPGYYEDNVGNLRLIWTRLEALPANERRQRP